MRLAQLKRLNGKLSPKPYKIRLSEMFPTSFVLVGKIK